jgi:hypothetical protein
MILEGLVTTENAAGELNLAPMGPLVEPEMRRLVLRPFPSSQTYRNLLEVGSGVFHVTDNVELLAQAAIGRVDPQPTTRPTPGGQGRILIEACRWYAFAVESIDDTAARVTIEARVVNWGRQRDFFGLNRAKHAVVEAAILATRRQLLPADEIAAAMAELTPLVVKTGGPAEQRAFQLLQGYLAEPLI